MIIIHDKNLNFYIGLRILELAFLRYFSDAGETKRFMQNLKIS